MVIETQSQSQQSKQPTQQPPTLINISTAPILTPESTLNLDQHPSAFNRVGRGINTGIESSINNQQSLQQCGNSTGSSTSTPIGLKHPPTSTQGTTQQHRMLLELIQKTND
uniref:Uncharacterized protein n=1 Tax=Meloidogyne incognita TaxID=6306 RepID=A0A914MJU9_MELIC